MTPNNVEELKNIQNEISQCIELFDEINKLSDLIRKTEGELEKPFISTHGYEKSDEYKQALDQSITVFFNLIRNVSIDGYNRLNNIREQISPFLDEEKQNNVLMGIYDVDI